MTPSIRRTAMLAATVLTTLACADSGMAPADQKTPTLALSVDDRNMLATAIEDARSRLVPTIPTHASALASAFEDMLRAADARDGARLDHAIARVTSHLSVLDQTADLDALRLTVESVSAFAADRRTSSLRD
jgi:hypothetical protein